MDPRAAARLMSFGRVAIGAGLMVAPRLFTPLWIGARGLTPGAKLMTQGLGARDLGLGLGVLAALRSNVGQVRPWIAAGILADATDLAATLIQRDDVPSTAIPLVVATAGAGIAMGVVALGADDASGGGSPAPVPA